jgi:hypothetical protein
VGPLASRNASLITTKTVFVLGAGASEPFGLPLGSRLYDLVIDDFGPSRRHVEEFKNTTPFSDRAIGQFVQALHYSGLTSVDAFLERRTEFVDIGKAAMALELLKREKHGDLWDAGRNWMTRWKSSRRTPSHSSPTTTIEV